MAALPPHSTARIWFDYITGSDADAAEHSVMFRFDDVDSPTVDQVEANFAALLEAMSPTAFGSGWRVSGCRVAAVGSDVTLPRAVDPAIAAFVGLGSNISPRDQAAQWTWQGRSWGTGRRASFGLYGIAQAVPDNYRFVASGGGTPVWVDESLAVLQSFETEFICIDGSPITWYSYVNANFNSYWERRLRSG